MAFVGDVILSARELMTDLPQALSAPSLSNPTAVSGSFPAGTWYFVATITNIWGESLPSNEVSLAIGAGQTAQLTFGFVGPNSNVATLRVYFGQSAGGENEYVSFTLIGGQTTVTMPSTSATPQTLPSRSTAYLPDTDGAAVGAFAIYRWLNQALGWAATKNRGGLPDFGAVGTVSGQPNYTMPGYWKKIDDAWYDGYPLGLLAKKNVFRRNPVPGFSGMLTVFQASDRLMVECWPQPSRTSNQTTLAVAMGLTDSVAFLASTAQYVIGFGMTQIGNEIVNFSGINGNNLLGLTRGMCGTTPQSHIVGEGCSELNLMISGYRVPSTYAVGQSTSTLYLPPGWDEALVSYILYRFRSAEQDAAEAKRYLQEATQKMSDLSANRIIAGPRQISSYGSSGPEVASGRGSIFGGVIVP